MERASMLRDGRGKRSLQGKSDVWKGPKPSPLPSQNAMQQQEASGPPSRTGARIKRKLQGATLDFVSSKIKQGKEKAHHEIQSAATRSLPFCVKAKEIPASESSLAKLMPEKHTLELVLDALQRRDTYKIFAEPVDPKKARAIHDLAKKVFHVLKTDPENFELEFSGTRQRSGRRPQGEAKDLNFNSSTRLPKNFRPGTVTNDVSSEGKLSLLTGPSISGRNMRGIPGVASTGADVDIREYALFSGARDGGRSGSDEADRRSTYTPWMLFHNENESIFHSDPKPLLLANDVSYRKSLTLFIKDLGPTAQMVAKRKLQGLSRDAPTQQTDCPIQDAIGQIPALSTWETDIMTNRISDQKVVDLLHGNQTVLKPTSEIIDLTSPDDGDKAAYTSKAGVGDKLNEKACQITKHESKSTAQVSGFNLGNENNNSATSSWWLSQTTIGFSSFSKMGNYNNGSKTRLGTKCQATSSPTTPSGRHGVMMQSSSEASHSSSRFTFDMPFLKSQLNQMRVMGQQDRLLHRTFQRGFSTGTGTGNNNQDQGQGQGTLFDPRGYIKVPVHFAEPSSSPQSTFLHKQPHSGSAAADTDLALQL